MPSPTATFRPAASAARTAPPSSLATDLAPPLWLPGEHFASALGFWVVGALMLVRVAPDLAAGSFFLPRVAATTHLFTLGWITTSIIGALYQLLPVALGVPIRSRRAAHLSFLLYVTGLALFVPGLATLHPGPMLVGAGLFASGLLLFLANLAATLRRAPERTVTWWALAAASVFLAVTVVLGASLSGNLRYGYLGAHRFLALGVHLHVALFGWVMLVVVGVGQRLLPMFLLAHGVDERAGKASVALLALGVGGLVVLHHGLTPVRTGLIAALIGGGTLAWLLQAARFFRGRRRPALDPGMRLAGLGMLHLAAALPLGGLFLLRGLAQPRIATAYVLALVVGAFSLFVAGHFYKILPFLVWLARFGPRMGKAPVPKLSELYHGPTATAAGGALALGAALLIAAVAAGLPALARPAAALYACGAVAVAGQMILILGRRA
jgi:hypothetical protein